MSFTAILLMIITITSKLIGLIRDKVLTYFYGISATTDAYLTVFTIIFTFFNLLSTAVVTGYIPGYNKIQHEDGEEKAKEFTHKLQTLFLVITSVIVIVVLLFPKQTIKLFAKDFTGERLELAIKIARISIFSLYFSVFVTIFQSYLNIKNKYIVAMMTGFPLNAMYILSYFLSKKYGVTWLGIGTVLATIAQVLFMIPFVIKEGYIPKLKRNFWDKNIKNLIIIIIPAIIGTSVNTINVIVDKSIASSTLGGISALNFADKINMLIQGIFTTSLVTIFYPNFSKLFTEKNKEKMLNMFKHYFTYIYLLIAPCQIAVMIFSREIIAIIFKGGSFQEQAISMTSGVLFFYALGMIFFAFRELLSKTFYAMEDTKTPMINGSIGVLINVILNIILSKFMGINGLALATSISSAITMGLLLINLRGKIGKFGFSKVLLDMIKITFMSIIMALAAYGTHEFLKSKGFGLFMAFLPTILVGATVYLILILYFKFIDIDHIKNKLFKK